MAKKTNLIVEIGGKQNASFAQTIKKTQLAVSKLSKNISREMNNAAAASAKGFKNVLRNDAFQAAAVGAVALGAGIKGSVKAAIDFQSAMSDVKKVVDIDPKGFKTLSKEIRALARDIPITAAGFAEIVASAGQAGVANNELTRFAESAAKMGVAFDISAGEAGDAMAKFRTAMKLDQDQVEALADSINHLSNNFAATAAETTNFMMRVGALKGQMAISEQSIAAFGTAMIGAGAAPEVAATSFRNLTKALMKGDAATKSQMSAFSQLGLSSGQLAKDMQEDATGTILDVFDRLAKAPAELRNSLSTQLFGSEARALTPLLTNTELLKKALDSVANSDLFKGSMQAEFTERSKTAANAQKIFKNNLNDLGIVIGSVVLPVLTDLMKGLAPVVAGIADFAEKNPFLTKALVVLTGAFVGLVAIAPFLASFIAVIGSIKLAIAGLMAMKGMAAIAMNFKILGIIGKVAMSALAGGIKMVAVGAIGILKGALVGLFTFMMANPIALFIAAIVGIGIAIVAAYKNVEWFRNGVDAVCSAVGQFFSNLWTGIVEGVQGFASGIATAFTNIVNGVTDFGSGIATAIAGAITKFAELATFAADIAVQIVQAYLSIPGKLLNVGGSIIDTIKEGFTSRFKALKDTVINSFKELRKLLPFSDAKKGPFKDLTASGRAIVTTLAQGVRDREGVLKNALGDTASLAMTSLAPIGGGGPAFAMPGGGSFGSFGAPASAAPKAAPKRSRGNDGNGVFGFLHKLLPIAGALIPGASAFTGLARGGLNLGEELIHGDGIKNLNPMSAAAAIAPVINITTQTDARPEDIARVVVEQVQGLMDESEAGQRAGLND